jgi:glycosyltransferase involved in cell wall biosynthesis
MIDTPPSFLPHLRILGTRGIPAQHGGFETFAEHLAPYMVQQGWRVTVYCQEEGAGPIREDDWHGVRRVFIPVTEGGATGTVFFDWKAMRHAAKERGVILTLGYNTAIFSVPYRFKRIPHLMNMDGIEWKRAKWSPMERLWLYLNELAGAGLANHLIADHPRIADHLAKRAPSTKITTIPYGSAALYEDPPPPCSGHVLEPGDYVLVIARPEPENSILEIVQAFSQRPRDTRLVILGNYKHDNAYHRAIQEAASPEVVFLGAIYDKAVVQSLRYYAKLYVHGHQVGGTNPSLVEALGAANPILAHDNQFNRWVAGPDQTYFRDLDDCSAALDHLLSNPAQLVNAQAASRARHFATFRWSTVLGAYERTLAEMST